MLKIGVLGVGHLGKIHLKCIQMIEDFELIGFYDPNDQNAKIAMANFGLKRFETLEELLEVVEVVDIVTPTITHFELAKTAIEKGKHLFIEKPLTNTIEEAETLLSLSRQYGVKVHVGHVERFNPAFMALEEMEIAPMFIEGHRLSIFNPRGTDVSVIWDLMIHDLDIVLKIVNSPVIDVSASGVAIMSTTPDIANARIEFENGCVANLTASRISMKQMRKLRFFQSDAYISLDFLDKTTEIIRLYDDNTTSNLSTIDNLMEFQTDNGKKYIHIDVPAIEPINAIQFELNALGQSIINDSDPLVTIEDGYNALVLGQRIINEINKRNSKLL